MSVSISNQLINKLLKETNTCDEVTLTLLKESMRGFGIINTKKKYKETFARLLDGKL